MAQISNGESGLSARNKLNEVIDKIEGTTAIDNSIDVTGTIASGALNLSESTAVTSILDEDNMASDSATALSTQQSIKAYVDAQVGTVDTLAEVLANGNTTGGTDLAVSAGDDITFTDTSKAIFGTGGASSQLQIYTDGTNSYIKDSGSGSMFLRSASNIYIQNAGGTANYFKGTDGGASELFHSGVSTLATTASGIDVTGTVLADGLTVDGDGLIQANVGAKLEIKSTDNFINADEIIGSVDFISADYNHPAQPIKVQLEARAFNNLGSGDLYISTTDAATKADRIRVSYNGDIDFYATDGTTPAFHWDAADEQLHVGGTTAPETAGISIETSAASGGLQIISPTTGRGDIFFGDTADLNVGQIRYAHSDNSMTFRANAADVLVLNSTGIDVTGTVTADGLTVETGTTSKITVSENTGSGTASIDFVATSSFPKTKIVTDVSAGSLTLETLGSDRLKIANNGDINFYATDGITQAFHWDAATERLGLGTTDPTAPLTILSTGWEHLSLKSSDVNATNKTGYVTVGHYTNAQESFGLISGQSTTSSNILNLGGGAAGLNTATSINLYTAANNTTVTGTSRLSIDSSGNVGIGVVPSAWSVGKAIEMRTKGNSVFTNGSGEMLTTANAYYNGGWKYGTSGAAAKYIVGNTNGTYIWQNAASGSADATITWSESMRIDASGLVGIGASSPVAKNHLRGSGTSGQVTASWILENSSSGTAGMDIIGSAGASRWRFSYGGGPSTGTNTLSEAMCILTEGASAGNVGIGTTSPSHTLTVQKDVDDYIAKLENDGNSTSSNGLWVDTRWNTATNTVFKVTTNSGTQDVIVAKGNGNVGIGTDSPSEILTIRKSVVATASPNYAVGLNLQNLVDGGNRILFGNSVTTTLAAIDGNVTSSGAGTDDGVISFSTAINGTLAERVRISSSGTMLVQTGGAAPSSSQEGVSIGLSGPNGGSISIANTLTSTFAGVMNFINGNGTVGTISTSASATSYNTSSDYRLKTDAQPMTGASARVQALNPVNFEWIASGDRVDGFLAHEAQAIVPEAVTGAKDAMMDEEYEVTPAVYEDVVIEAVLDDEGNELEAERTEQNLVTDAVMGTRSVPDMQGIDQSKLVPLLTAALQEALTKIDAMETRIAALEGE